MKHKKLEEMSLVSNSETLRKKRHDFITGFIIGSMIGVLIVCVILFIK